MTLDCHVEVVVRDGVLSCSEVMLGSDSQFRFEFGSFSQFSLNLMYGKIELNGHIRREIEKNCQAEPLSEKRAQYVKTTGS